MRARQRTKPPLAMDLDSWKNSPSRLAAAWQRLRTSLWLIPGIIVTGATALAVALIQLDLRFASKLMQRWPGLFGAGTEGARAMLTAIAGSMITVAGVIFSITLVVLSSAATQYSPRVLRSFMADRLNQSVLGVFVGIYAYCLVVLRTIRGTDEGAFVPALAVLGGVVLAFVGVAYLIYFIHHVGVSIQASAIISRIAEETTGSFRGICLGSRPGRDGPADGNVSPVAAWPVQAGTVRAATSGYVVRLDVDRLVRLACDHDLCIRMDRALGQFVVRCEAVASVTGVASPSPGLLRQLSNAVEISRERSAELDPTYGLRQLVDVALRALSSGINDPTTARMAIDQLTAIFVELARLGPRRRSYCDRADRPRLALSLPAFQTLLRDSYGEIRQAAKGSVAVLRSIASSLARLESEVCEPWRREALLIEADALREEVEWVAAHVQADWDEPRQLIAGLIRSLSQAR